MTRLRCECGNWLGESPLELVYVERVQKWASGEDPPVQVTPPRDLRLCKSCDHVAVFVPKESLTRASA